MYPPVVQLETRRLERQLDELRAAAEARATFGPPGAPAVAPARPHRAATLTWAVMPALTRFFRGWLAP